MDSIPFQEPRKRLIVLVPDSLAGNLDLARKVYGIALREHCDVLYLALVDDDENMVMVYRSMATMKTVTAGPGQVVESKLTKANRWLKSVQDTYRPGDILVCHEEQSVNDGFMKAMPLSEYLRDAFKARIISISGYYKPQQVRATRWLQSIAFWLGCMGIVVGFFLLEIRLDHLTQGFAHKSLLILALVIEFMAIWAWNNVINRS